MAERRRGEPFIENDDRFPPSDRRRERERRSTPSEQELRRRRAQQRRRQNSVFRYIAIMFGAAFVLLLFTFMMERRQSQQQIDDLKQSASALQTLQGMIEENSALKVQVEQLENQVSSLQSQASTVEQNQTQLRSQLQELEKTTQAMDWFWQIDEAYVRGRYTLCRSLIQSLEDANLQDALPKESITNNERFSPADRYAEIRGRVVK